LNALQMLIVLPPRRKAHQRLNAVLESLELRQVLSVNPISVSSVAHISTSDGHVNATVATFTDTDSSADLHSFKAVINWGDGKSSKGHITAGVEGNFIVTGKHVYHVTGDRQITVTVSDKSGNSATDGGYDTDKLVADQAGHADFTDPNLVNPWGLAIGPGGTFWIANNGTGVATLVEESGVVDSLVVTIPTPPNTTGSSAPTGVVYNGTGDFDVTDGPSYYIFSTEDGTISGWNSGTAAELKVDNSASGAIYKGLAIGTSGNAIFIYATDFHNGQIDVFDKNFAAVQTAGDFKAPKLAKGYAPFGIENVNGVLFVTYAKQDADKVDDTHAKGWGYVAEFTTDGHFIKMLAARGPLNAPWGVAQAPNEFGQFSNDLLVGNFGDGTVNAFDPDTGVFLGQLTDTSGNTLTIDGLWAIKFAEGAAGGGFPEIYFTAGPGDESHGLFGELGSVGEPTRISIGS
ncbi:MAG: hypothetical protein JWN70_1377, partial [Planctomycetaceae bacterium]|nr:hypothetical protein [Planctomycetaceae bacterium]